MFFEVVSVFLKAGKQFAYITGEGNVLYASVLPFYGFLHIVDEEAYGYADFLRLGHDFIHLFDDLRMIYLAGDAQGGREVVGADEQDVYTFDLQDFRQGVDAVLAFYLKDNGRFFIGLAEEIGFINAAVAAGANEAACTAISAASLEPIFGI